MAATPDKCHAVAHTPNGAVPGMSDAHPCRNNAKADLAKDGVNYPVCGMHIRVFRRGAHGIEAYADRFTRTGRVHLARHEPHVLAFRAERAVLVRDAVNRTLTPPGEGTPRADPARRPVLLTEAEAKYLATLVYADDGGGATDGVESGSLWARLREAW